MRVHFRRVRTGDKNLELIQDNAAAAFAPLEASDVIDGLLTEAFDAKSGQDNLIPHRLGRLPKMWTLANIDSNSTVWSPASTQLLNKSMDSSYINIRVSSNCKVVLWVS